MKLCKASPFWSSVIEYELTNFPKNDKLFREYYIYKSNIIRSNTNDKIDKHSGVLLLIKNVEKFYMDLYNMKINQDINQYVVATYDMVKTVLEECIDKDKSTEN